MNATKWARVKDLYFEAVGQPLAERETFLNDACALLNPS